MAASIPVNRPTDVSGPRACGHTGQVQEPDTNGAAFPSASDQPCAVLTTLSFTGAYLG